MAQPPPASQGALDLGPLDGRPPHPAGTPDRSAGPARRSAPRHTTPPTARPSAQSRPAADPELAILGLCPGEAVRWRSATAGRWQAGTVTRRERDGSIGVVDRRGAARSLPVERLHVGCLGSRGGPAWEPLTERAGRSEQLCLLDGPAPDR